MHNELKFDRNGKAATFYKQLTKEHRQQLDAILDYLRGNPEPDGDSKIAVYRPPIFVHYYNDGIWKIAYGLSYIPQDRIFKIDILVMAFA